MIAPNPYQPPQGAPLNTGTDPGGRCPRCGSDHITAPSFTWWGGVLGPKLLDHRVCQQCRFGFNAKTGRSNTAAIAIYTVVLSVLAFGLMYALWS